MTHPGLADGPIYLDCNATTPVDPAVLDAALPYVAVLFGNPSSRPCQGAIRRGHPRVQARDTGCRTVDTVVTRSPAVRAGHRSVPPS